MYKQVRPFSINRIITDIFHYDLSYLLDDYVHCHKYHDYMDIYNHLQKLPEYLCVCKECLFLMRNHRDREAMTNNDDHANNEITNRIKLYLCVSDSLNVATMQILDKIHCYLLHSFYNQPRDINNDENKKNNNNLPPQIKKTKSFGKLKDLDIINVNDIRFNQIDTEYAINSTESVKFVWCVYIICNKLINYIQKRNDENKSGE